MLTWARHTHTSKHLITSAGPPGSHAVACAGLSNLLWGARPGCIAALLRAPDPAAMHARSGSKAASSGGRSAPGFTSCWPQAKGWSPVSRACASLSSSCPAPAAFVPATAASAAAPPAGVACARRLRCRWITGERPAASCPAASASKSAGARCRRQSEVLLNRIHPDPSQHGLCCNIHLCLSAWLPAAQR